MSGICTWRAIVDAIAHFRLRPDGDDYEQKGTFEDGQDGITDLDGPQSLALSPDDRFLYVVSAASDAVVVFKRHPETGALEFEMAVRDDEGMVDGHDGAYDVALSPEGHFVYVAGLFDDGVAILQRNASTGRLTWQGWVQDGAGEVDGLNGANGLALSPDGKQLLVAGRGDGALAVFDRDAFTGMLDFVTVVDGATTRAWLEPGP